MNRKYIRKRTLSGDENLILIGLTTLVILLGYYSIPIFIAPSQPETSFSSLRSLPYLDQITPFDFLSAKNNSGLKPPLWKSQNSHTRDPATASYSQLSSTSKKEKEHQLEKSTLQNTAIETSLPESVVFDCRDENTHIEIMEPFARLQSSHCNTLHTSRIKIVNTSNGFTASLYFQKEFEFSTDYISLALGNNEIEVLFENQIGQIKLIHIVINRVLASNE